MALVQTKGEQTRYQYDPLGRRILKASEDNQTRFYWLGDCLLKEVQTSAAKGTESTTYLFEPEQGNGESFKPVAVVKADAAHPQGAVYHIHTDHLGTPQEVSNAEGQIIWAAQYRAYGALKRQLKVAGSDVHVADQPDRSFTQNLRFMGQYFDEETGLHYNRHRYYDPECGQFTTQDPIGLMGGLNNYQYVPNPVSWVDPLGLTCKELTAAEKSAAYQGSDPYFGIDYLNNISIPKGTKLAHITYRTDGVITGNYFTTVEAVESSRAVDGVVNAKALNQGVQVYAGDGRTEYKRFVQIFEAQEDIPYGGAAFGKTKANPQFNPGRYKLHDQYFVDDQHFSKLTPVQDSLEEMNNIQAPDVSKKLDILRGR